MLWFGASHGMLAFAATTPCQGALLSLSLAFASAGVGFGIRRAVI